MSDPIDRANEIAEQNRIQALKQQRNNQEQPCIVDGVRVCLDCDYPVSLKRIKAVNSVRCLECQTLEEIRTKQGRG